MQVILYSTGCPKCSILKKKLNEKNIDYEEVNDEKTMLSLGFDSVPILSVDGELLEFTQANNWINERGTIN